MPLVHIPALLLPLTAGVREQQISGNTIRELIEQLDKLYPGIRERLLDGNHLRSGLSVFVDGLVRREGLDFEVSANSEVHFIPAVAGGLDLLSQAPTMNQTSLSKALKNGAPNNSRARSTSSFLPKSSQRALSAR